MDPNQKPKGNAKDFFLNLGAIVALYTVLISLVNLLFTIINQAFPQVTSGYNFYSSPSISWPVATLIIFFPILVLLMWLLEKSYVTEPERQNMGIHRWLTYITLFVSGLVVAGDLITVIYYFIDGQELTTAFLLKVLVLLLVAGGLFLYYITDIRGKLTHGNRNIWRIVTALAIIGSVAWGFSVLGSPRTQRLYKYDEQKLNDLMGVNGNISNYYSVKGTLPQNLSDVETVTHYTLPKDLQSGKSYEYQKTSDKTYNLCAEFNKPSNSNSVSRNGVIYPTYPYGTESWTHPAGRHCFEQTVNPNMYPPGKLPA